MRAASFSASIYGNFIYVALSFSLGKERERESKEEVKNEDRKEKFYHENSLHRFIFISNISVTTLFIVFVRKSSHKEMHNTFCVQHCCII